MIAILSRIPAPAGGTVQVPIHYAGHGVSVSAVVFAIDYDENWLTYTGTAFSLPAGYGSGASPHAGDPNRELDVSLFFFGNPPVPLPDGVFATMSFTVGSPATATEAHVKFATSPAPSFGTTTGGSVSGTSVNGSVLISP